MLCNHDYISLYYSRIIEKENKGKREIKSRKINKRKENQNKI